MIKRLLPYPLLFVGLVLMWVLLQQSAGIGQLLLGAAVAFGATHAMAALVPEQPKVRRLDKVLLLMWLVLVDVVRSNIAVTAIIILGHRRPEQSGFLRLPLDLRDKTGLAVLACIVTATPGSAWLEHRAADNSVLIHLLDLKSDQEWITTFKHRYETLLLEIFQ
jgi:multicomponent K+:H+ antiporter subunit E